MGLKRNLNGNISFDLRESKKSDKVTEKKQNDSIT